MFKAHPKPSAFYKSSDFLRRELKVDSKVGAFFIDAIALSHPLFKTRLSISINFSAIDVGSGSFLWAKVFSRAFRSEWTSTPLQKRSMS